MSGILSYGAYVPFTRISKAVIASAYGKKAPKGEKAVAYYDEDSLTMAVGASLNAMGSRDAKTLDAIFFATTTAPYREKQCATQIAACLDAKKEIRTADFEGSLRAGSDAMLVAAEMTGKNVLVAAGDCRLGAADGSFEMDLGDGAAAFLFGDKNAIAEVKASCSVSMDSYDMWRSDTDKYVRFWDVRYAQSMHYEPLIRQAVGGVLEKSGLTAGDVAKVVCYAHEDRHRAGVLAKLGFAPEQIAASYYGEIGNTGCAAAPIMLAGALDEAKPGDKLLYVTYGEGAEAILFEITEHIASLSRIDTVRAQIARKNSDLPYGKYLRWKDFLSCEPQRRPEQERSSLPDYFRNYQKNNALYGSRCTFCGTPQFPAQRVCARCHHTDEMEPYRFLGKKATVRTFTLDGLSLSLDPPNYLVVIDFAGGGKLMTYLVDCKKEDIRVGMPVTFSFRRIFTANGVHTYFWKAVPALEKEGE